MPPFDYFITNGLPSAISKNIFFGKKETFLRILSQKRQTQVEFLMKFPGAPGLGGPVSCDG